MVFTLGNGIIKIGRYSDVECTKVDAENGNFFKAKLDFKTRN